MLAVTAVVLAAPALVAVARNGREIPSVHHEVGIAGAGLFTVLPLFLLASEVVTGVAYGGVARYYQPILPLSPLVAYSLAATDKLRPRQRITALLRLTGEAYLAAFVLVTCVLLIALPVHGMWRVIGTYEFHSWPSFKLTYDYSPARRYVLGVLKTQPGVVFITNRPQWFNADPDVDRSQIHRIESCGALRATHVTGPVRLLVLAIEPQEERQEFYTSNELGQRFHAECFDRLPPLRLVQRFPDERLEVLDGLVPDGVRISLKSD